jgi:hypothetical protein
MKAVAYKPPNDFNVKYVYVEPQVIKNKITLIRSVNAVNDDILIYTSPLNKFFYCTGITVSSGTAGVLVGIRLEDSGTTTPHFVTGSSISLCGSIIPLFVLSPNQEIRTLANAPNNCSVTIVGYEE